jgi:hypothetical protein
LSPEQLARIAQRRAPQRLSHYDVDPVSGQIAWPTVLGLDAYADFTAELDKLFAQRAEQNGQFTSDQFLQVQQVAGELIAVLNKNIGDYPPMDFMAARRFDESLAFEARQVDRG